MSYYLYDVNGYVGNLASNNGLVELKEVIPEGPLTDLFDSGFVEITPEVIESVKNLPEGIPDNFKKLALECEEIIIITDGVGIEDEGESTMESNLKAIADNIKTVADFFNIKAGPFEESKHPRANDGKFTC